jgi:hypothetical protein
MTRPQRNLSIFVLLIIGLVVGLLALFSVGAFNSQSGTERGRATSEKADSASAFRVPWPSPTPAVRLPTPYLPGASVTNLVGASSEQVGQFAQEFVRYDYNLDTLSEPQVALAKTINRSEIVTLGLGCIDDWASIEEPPLVLIVLKGDFEHRKLGRGKQLHYVAYVFDTWGVQPMFFRGSATDEPFRIALNEPARPAE